MKKTSISLLIFFCSITCWAQISLTSDKQLEKEIIRSGIIHSPLPLDFSRSAEAKGLQKKVLYTMPLSTSEEDWKASGYGNLSTIHTLVGIDLLCLSYPASTGKRAIGSASDPDYATYGNAGMTLELNGANWEKYNRIAFSFRPICDGAQVVNINFNIENESSAKKEGYNRQSGSHLINLTNKENNLCYLDLGEYQRDKIKRISFNVSIKGKDRTNGDLFEYLFEKIELQQVEDPEIISGWMPGNNRIVYSTTGYMLNDNKTAIVNMEQDKQKNRFQLVNEKNQVVFSGQIKKEKTTIGEFNVADFSNFNQSGLYSLKIGDVTTPAFRIGENIWDNSLWRVLNFIFCQRCGYPVPGKHGTCHIDLCSKHDGKMISFAGGWHDAGDLSQQVLQTGDVTYALFEVYNKLKDKNELLAGRMLEEAEWGLDFMLRNRYGDGYRASSVGLLIWQDGIFGTLDDISSVRVHNSAFDNFLFSAYEAYAAMSVKEHDPMLYEHLTRVAEADFAFALKRHDEVGYGEFIHFYEHSYNTSKSQYMATISWAASMLYKLTEDSYYAEKAVEYIDYTLDCQRKEPLNDKDNTSGFFYRDQTKKVIVHYNHQSREQVYMQAMTLLCETQAHHKDYSKWAESIRLYGNYLKNLMQYTAPYGMIASGIYHVDEAKDEVSFQHSHLFVDGSERERYSIQLQKGVKLDEEHYLKRFPVSFGIFNGNTAVHLSMGKAAAICGKFLNDEKLLQIGREQLYWTVGKNPFGQSLIYGEGDNYPQMDTFSSGEMTGEMPVGIRALDDEDFPYWPQTNNATYKEVWVTSAGKWLTLVAEY
ncbi:MAG: glycoside hydrolase family 9 protein [Dysgonomonas sp.]